MRTLPFPADLRVKLKKSEKRELIKLCNMKETMIQVINGPLGTVTEELVMRQEVLETRGVETIQTTA